MQNNSYTISIMPIVEQNTVKCDCPNVLLLNHFPNKCLDFILKKD